MMSFFLLLFIIPSCLCISPVEVLRRLQNSPVVDAGTSPEEQAWITRAHKFESLKDSDTTSRHSSSDSDETIPDLLSTAWLLLKMLPNKHNKKPPENQQPVQRQPQQHPVQYHQQHQHQQYRYYHQQNATIKPGISDMEDAKFLQAEVPTKQPRHQYTYRLISAPKTRYYEEYQHVAHEAPSHVSRQPPPAAAPAPPLPPDNTVKEQLPLGPSYKCLATGRNFCTLEEEYPRDLMTELETFSSILANFTTEVPSVEASGPLFSELPLESAPCLTEIGAVQPGWFRDEQAGKWLFALQTGTFQQWIRIEDCRSVGASCQYVMPYYRSFCQPRLALHQVMAWDPESRHRLAFGYLKTPGGCECHVTM